MGVTSMLTLGALLLYWLLGAPPVMVMLAASRHTHYCAGPDVMADGSGGPLIITLIPCDEAAAAATA
eukprot:scaffold124043_cov18-Prasinocladus_malaysianus.AAC.1